MRGDTADVELLAAELDLTVDRSDGRLAERLLGRNTGLVEAVVPQRSARIGQAAFPGTVTEDGLTLLAVQRGGTDLHRTRITLRAGDHLLLQGDWPALEHHLSTPDLLVVDAPDLVKRQAVPLGRGAPTALAVLGLLVVLLAFDLVPAPIAATVCACLMVITRVVRISQLYRGIDWNTCILIGAMIAPANAMTSTGTARMIADHVVDALGDAGPRVVLAGLFLVAAVITQFISNTSTALVMIPIGLATATDLGISPLPMMLAVAMGASASFLTPFANGVSLMVYGPGAYRFGDFWRLGTLMLAWTAVVTVLIVPLVWPF